MNSPETTSEFEISDSGVTLNLGIKFCHKSSHAAPGHQIFCSSCPRASIDPLLIFCRDIFISIRILRIVIKIEILHFLLFPILQILFFRILKMELYQIHQFLSNWILQFFIDYKIWRNAIQIIVYKLFFSLSLKKKNTIFHTATSSKSRESYTPYLESQYISGTRCPPTFFSFSIFCLLVESQFSIMYIEKISLTWQFSRTVKNYLDSIFALLRREEFICANNSI